MQVFPHLMGPSLSEIPPSWHEASHVVMKFLDDAGLLDESLKHAGKTTQVEFFAGILSRLHLNMISYGEGGRGIYALASFLNHSCKPNVTAAAEGVDAVLSITAQRDILSGDELCISYAGPEPCEDFLEWAYGIKCSETCNCDKYAITE
jgi:hypothetical protein